MPREQRPINDQQWVKESRFGKWFLSTDIWVRYVLSEAIQSMQNLLKNHSLPESPNVLDAGCGRGLAFGLLEEFLRPKLIVGIDIDKELINQARESAESCECVVELIHGSATSIEYPSEFFDIIFCHQLLHHVAEQERVLDEFHRLLAPGGLLLIGESCRAFIDTFPVRLLFRHPMEVQKSADEYVALVKSAGFQLQEQDTYKSCPWWSQRDFGLLKKMGLKKLRPHPDTEVIIVGRK